MGRPSLWEVERATLLAFLKTGSKRKKTAFSVIPPSPC